MNILVCKTKGGTGASMIASNLICMRSRDVVNPLLIDGDDQETVNNFAILRDNLSEGQTGFTCIRLVDKQLRTEFLKLKDKYSDIIIDAGGRDNRSLRAALSVVDLALIPICPSSFDLWTIDNIEEIVNEMREVNPNLKAYFILNKIDPPKEMGKEKIYTADTLEAVEFLKYNTDENGVKTNRSIEYLHNPVSYRKAYQHCASKGQDVTEYKKDTKAIAEIKSIYDFIYNNHKN